MTRVLPDVEMKVFGYLSLRSAPMRAAGTEWRSWRERLGFRDSVAWTSDWGRRGQADALTVTREQIAAFEGLE